MQSFHSYFSTEEDGTFNSGREPDSVSSFVHVRIKLWMLSMRLYCYQRI
jgi:hypothetical protein